MFVNVTWPNPSLAVPIAKKLHSLTGKAGFSLYMRLPHLLAETLLICACFSAASSLRSSQGFLVSLWVWQTASAKPTNSQVVFLPERKRELDSRCSLKEEGGGLAQQEKNHGPTNPASDLLARDHVDPVERAL